MYNKINADATPAAFQIPLIVLSLIPFLNALSNYYRTHSKMSLIRVKNIFTPANINSIFILYDYKRLRHRVKYQASKSDELKYDEYILRKNKWRQEWCDKIYEIYEKN